MEERFQIKFDFSNLIKMNLKYNELKEISLLLAGVDTKEIIELINKDFSFVIELINKDFSFVIELINKNFSFVIELDDNNIKLKNLQNNTILKFDFDIVNQTYNSKKEEFTLIDDFDLL